MGQMIKMYNIFWKPSQDLYAFLTSFKSDECDDGSHPAAAVLDLLTEGDVPLRLQHLTRWYEDYANLRGMPYLFKAVGQDSQ